MWRRPWRTVYGRNDGLASKGTVAGISLVGGLNDTMDKLANVITLLQYEQSLL